jgi:plasmid stability protein
LFASLVSGFHPYEWDKGRYHTQKGVNADVAFIAVIVYNANMEQTQQASSTTLTIRNVDRRLKERLRVRAAKHGHSMEAELRDILVRSLEDEPENEVNLAEAIRRRFAPFGGVELELPPREPVREPPSFE